MFRSANRFEFHCHQSFLIRLGLCLAISIAGDSLVSGIQSVCAVEPTAAADHAVVEALLRLPPGALQQHPEQRPAVLRYLSRNVGTSQYISVARQLKVQVPPDELYQMLVKQPVDNISIDAAKLLVAAKNIEPFRRALSSDSTDQRVAGATAMGHVWHPQLLSMLQAVVQDEDAGRQLRIAAAASVGRSKPGQEFLLELARQDKISDDIQFTVANALLGSTHQDIKEAARPLVTASPTSSGQAIPPINDLVRRRGSAARGKTVFNTVGTCIKCHKVLGEGKEVGPDLSEIGSKLSRQDMYVAILNPSAAVSHNYETYTLVTVDGQVLTGLLMNQTDQEIKLRTQEGIDHTLPPEDVELLKMQPVSLMPADLQRLMSLENLVDLVDYLVLLRKPGEGAFNVEANGAAGQDQHDPEAAIEGFEVASGVQVELFAAEPQLLSPTSIDVDAQGRVWVCEAVNYRHFRNPQNPERSEGDRILVLEDTDQDGRADRRTVFYQGRDIDSPHGVTVLGDEVFVSAGENVWVFTDQDGDLKPDSRRKLFTGISGVQHDHGIHAFGVGPDGKLYFNFGNEGKQLKSATGETIVDKAGNVVDDSRNPYQQGMVFRCNPDGSQLETLGWNFRNNWEVCVDSFGNLWQSDNDDDGNRGTRINFVMEFGNYGYRDELTGATWKTKRIGFESEIPLQHWHLNDPGVVPNILQTGAGSPTGICFYEGDLLPAPFHNQILHTDPGPNVVRAYPVQHDGAGYQASILNLVKGVKDPWFRPVDVCVAPDGSLFVADWYDPGVGGHRMGDAKHGRIFRVTPTGHSGYRVPSLSLSSAADAVAALRSPNLATRYLAQQRLSELGESAISELESLAQDRSPTMRARALWQLGLLSSDPAAVVQQALEDTDPDLRIVGIRMARQHDQDLADLVQRMINDQSAHVRRELAIALRHLTDPRAAALWAQLAMQHDGQDRWTIEALGIAADGQWDSFFQAWLDRVGPDWNTPGGRDIVWRCRSPLACKYLAQLIRESESEQEQYRYFRAFDFHEGQPKLEALNDLLTGAP